MFGYNTPTYNTQPYYNPQPYQTRQSYQPMYQQPMMQDGAVQARIVSCKEEAIAAPVNPGVRTIFLDASHGAVYSKLIDPQTGVSDFHEYLEPVTAQPEAPQYLTVEMFDQYRESVERRFDSLTAQPKRQQKGAVVDD